MNHLYRVSGELGNTDVVMTQTFWLGACPGLHTERLEFIANKLKEFF